MSYAILHLTGDANVPPVRVPSTLALAARLARTPVFVGVWTAEADELVLLLGANRVHAAFDGPPHAPRYAYDTLTEVLYTQRFVRGHGARTLLIATEPGHLGRALLIARILYLGSGIRVDGWPSKPGGYRSPVRRLVLDAIRAVIARVSGRVVNL